MKTLFFTFIITISFFLNSCCLQCKAQSLDGFLEGGFFIFDPAMEELQSYLKSISISKMQLNRHVYFLNFGIYFFDEYNGQTNKFTFSIYETWHAEDTEPTHTVKLSWGKILLGLSYDWYFIP